MKTDNRPWRMEITVEGLNLSRFVRRAGEQGIALESLTLHGRHLTAQVRENDLLVLKALAENGGWRLQTGRRLGTGRLLEKLRSRMALVAAMLLGVAALAQASQVMWRVEIENAGIYAADLPEYLAALDITPPRWKREVDTGALRDLLEWRYPETAWIECGWRGMTLTIRVVDGVASGMALSSEGAGDVVASRDGIVASILTKAGTAVVKPGTLVRKGDVLIRGEERTADGQTRPVSARGVVMARVWDSAAVTMRTTEQQTIYSGRVQDTLLVTTPLFPLWQVEESGFATQDVSRRTMPLGGFFFPMTCVWETRYECQMETKERLFAEVSGQAGTAALRKLREKIGMNESLVDKWVNCSMIEDEVLLAVATGERLVDIAIQQPSGMEENALPPG